MSLHSTYDEKERHWPVACFTRLLTSEFFEVGGESLRALVVGDGGGLWADRNSPSTAFFGLLPINSASIESPGAAANTNPLKKGAKQSAAAGLAGEAPKCPSAGSGHLVGGHQRRNPFFAIFLRLRLFFDLSRQNPMVTIGYCPHHGRLAMERRRFSLRYSPSSPGLRLRHRRCAA